VEHLSDWLEQLSDKQVVERAERLEVFSGATATDHDRAIAVLDGMRREALDFLAGR
jgi:hypothetical protein